MIWAESDAHMQWFGEAKKFCCCLIPLSQTSCLREKNCGKIETPARYILA